MEEEAEGVDDAVVEAVAGKEAEEAGIEGEDDVIRIDAL